MWFARLVFIIVLALPTAAEGQQQQPAAWSQLPRMKLERQFAGPLQDTLVQRWRDPADGTVCYIYLPITAPHSQPTASGYVQYGANGIGSISCVAGPPPPPVVANAPAARPPTAAAPPPAAPPLRSPAPGAPLPALAPAR